MNSTHDTTTRNYLQAAAELLEAVHADIKCGDPQAAEGIARALAGGGWMELRAAFSPAGLARTEAVLCLPNGDRHQLAGAELQREGAGVVQ